MGSANNLPKPPWRLNPFWTQLLGLTLLGELQEIFQINATSSSHYDKAMMRGLFIREISKCKSKTRELTVVLQNRVSETEKAFIQSPSSTFKFNWDEAQTLLKDHMLQTADNKRFFIPQKYFMEDKALAI